MADIVSNRASFSSPQSVLSLVNLKDGQLFNFAKVAPSPSKDYVQMVVTLEEVILRRWKVSLKKELNNILPSEVRESHAKFLVDNTTQREIGRIFGDETLHYVKGLAGGHVDYLPRLSTDILYKIIAYLALDDISRLSMISKRFRELCKSDELWQQLYTLSRGTAVVSDDLKSLAESSSWRSVFFTSKLQLQVQLHRNKASGQTISRTVSKACVPVAAAVVGLKTAPRGIMMVNDRSLTTGASGLRRTVANDVTANKTSRTSSPLESAIASGRSRNITGSKVMAVGKSKTGNAEGTSEQLAAMKLIDIERMSDEEFSKWIYTSGNDDRSDGELFD